MALQITNYRVLIELDEALPEELQAYGDTVHDFNTAESIPRDVLFTPVGWEPGIAPAQKLLYDDFRRIDFFVLVLWDRWPASVEQQYRLALEWQADPRMPLREVVPFFKSVPARQLGDPGEELRRVLEFRERLRSERRARFEAFGTVEEFRGTLRRHLSRWLIDHERRLRRPAEVAHDARPPAAPTGPDEPEPAPRGLKAPPPTDEPDGLNEYGLFLQREGMLDEAEEVHRRALELLKPAGPSTPLVVTYGHLGVIHRRRQQFDESEAMFLDALAMSEQLDRPKGIAASSAGLGLVYRQRNRLDRAAEMFGNALWIERELDRAQGMATCYENLALIADIRGQHDKAKEMRRMARAVGEEPEYPFGELFPSEV